MIPRQDKLIEIVKAKVRRLEISQLIISVCVVFLSLWCGYNIFQIVSKYNKKETIISLENNAPSDTAFPGVTICAGSIFKPSILAEMYPDTFGVSLRAYELWRKRTQGIPSEDAIDRSHQLRRRQELLAYESWAMSNHSALDIMSKYSVRLEELIGKCEFVPMNVRQVHLFREEGENVCRPMPIPCDQIFPILESIYEGKKCFTLFSNYKSKLNFCENGTKIWTNTDLGRRPTKGKRPSWHGLGPDHKGDLGKNCNQTDPEQRLLFNEIRRARDAMFFDYNPSIEITVKGVESDIWSSYLYNAPILMTVHPPDILQNRRDFLFFQVIRNTFNEITFTKKTTVLLKHRTPRCVDYNTTHLSDTEFGVENYRTRDHCITSCVLGSSHRECLNFYGVIYISEDFFSKLEHLNRTICPHDRQNYTAFLAKRNACESTCPSECIKTIYEVSGQMRNSDNGARNCIFWYTRDDPMNRDDNSGHRPAEYRDESEESSPSDESYSFVGAYGNDSHFDSTLLQLIQTTSFLPLRRVANRRVVRLPRRHLTRSVSGAGEEEAPGENGNDCNSHFSIRISPKPFITVRHQDAITQETFFGTLGGHAGIWLGLSLYKVIKFAVHTAYRLLYRIVRQFSRSFGYTFCH